MSGELKLINVMLVILLGVWLGTAVNSFRVPSSANNFSLSSSSKETPARDARQESAPSAAAVSKAYFEPSAIQACAGLLVASAEGNECVPCPSGEVLVLVASDLDGNRPSIPDEAVRYCTRAGPLPGGLTASGGWCYELGGSLVCDQVLDERGGAWSCPAAAGAIPAWQDVSSSRPACIPKVKSSR